MIPDLVEINGIWAILPPGVHEATLENLRQKYAYNSIRKRLIQGLEEAVKVLRGAGCRDIYLDGSFVTEKTIPGDFDACWCPIGVDPSKLDPVFFDFKDARKNQKAKFGGEFFPSSYLADGKNTYLDFFQKDKDSGEAKGIIKIITI